MDTRFLESLIVVSELGSVASAARKLGITPAAVAQRIAALEKEFGAPLLKRVGRASLPTRAGFVVIERGRKIIEDIRDVKALATDDPMTGLVRIGGISTALTAYLPPLLKELNVSAPQLEIYLLPGTSTDLYQKIVEGDLDAAFLIQPPFAIPKTLEWHHLISEQYVVVAPRHLPVTDVHDLLRTQPFIRYDRQNWGGQIVDEYLRAVGITPLDQFELDSLDAIAVMVSTGLGVALLPNWLGPWPEDLNVIKHPLPKPTAVRQVGIVSNRASPRRTVILRLWELAKASVQPNGSSASD